MYQQEMQRIADGAPPRNLERYERWRKKAHPENVALFGWYGTYMAGQYNGQSMALSLPALVAAFELDGVERKFSPHLSRRLLFLHSQVAAQQPKGNK